MVKEFRDDEGNKYWLAWENNFYNAKRFFESKGNMATKSKLKAEWYNCFFRDVAKAGDL